MRMCGAFRQRAGRTRPWRAAGFSDSPPLTISLAGGMAKVGTQVFEVPCGPRSRLTKARPERTSFRNGQSGACIKREIASRALATFSGTPETEGASPQRVHGRLTRWWERAGVRSTVSAYRRPIISWRFVSYSSGLR